jgi:hypothetical protein
MNGRHERPKRRRVRTMIHTCLKSTELSSSDAEVFVSLRVPQRADGSEIASKRGA